MWLAQYKTRFINDWSFVTYSAPCCFDGTRLQPKFAGRMCGPSVLKVMHKLTPQQLRIAGEAARVCRVREAAASGAGTVPMPDLLA